MTKNEVCVRTDPDNKNIALRDTCVALTKPEAQVVGADAAAYFSMNVKFNIPEVEITDYSLGTGGWVGPYAVFVPDDGDAKTGANSTRTEMRYANGLYGDILQPPDLYNLTSKSDFLTLFGPTSINATTHVQVGGIDADPIAYALGGDESTCYLRNARPVLPLFDYTFVDGDGDGDTELDVRFHYRLFTYPKEGSPMRTVFPKLQAKGWPVSGPYCYKNQLIGWTMNFDFDTMKGSKYVNFLSGCVAGIPCIPDWFVPCDTCSNAFIETDQNKATVQLKVTLYLALSTALLLIVAVCLCCSNCYIRRAMRNKDEELSREKEELESISTRGGGGGTTSEYNKLLAAPEEGRGSGSQKRTAPNW